MSSETKRKYEEHFKARLKKLEKDCIKGLSKIVSRDIPLKFIDQVSEPVSTIMRMNVENILKKHPELAPESQAVVEKKQNEE